MCLVYWAKAGGFSGLKHECDSEPECQDELCFEDRTHATKLDSHGFGGGLVPVRYNLRIVRGLGRIGCNLAEPLQSAMAFEVRTR